MLRRLWEKKRTEITKGKRGVLLALKEVRPFDVLLKASFIWDMDAVVPGDA